MSTSLLRVDRIFGAGPFREIGRPLVADLSPDGEVIVACGDLGPLQWHGHSVSGGAGRYRYMLAVYQAGDLSCVHLVPTRWPAQAIAFHPALPVVTVGTGSYDGGYCYEGELLFLNLTTGTVVSLLEWPREVRMITWRNERTLDLVLAVPTDEDAERLGTTSVACSVQQDDWDIAADGMLWYPREESPVPDGEPPDPAAAVTLVDQLCRERGVTWEARRAVWAVRVLPDGRILSTLEGVALECWPPHSDQAEWRLPAEGGGCQVHVPPEGRTAFTLTQTAPRWSRTARTWVRDPSLVTEVTLDGGEALATWDTGAEAVIAARSDGWWALRDAGFARDPSVGSVTLRSPHGIRSGVVHLSRYDLFNHYFGIRYAPDLLFLQGSESKPWADKWVVAVDPPGAAVRRLFPLEWDKARGRHLSGGPGACLSGDHGPILVHAGTVQDGRGLLPGNSFIICRDYPSGEPLWVFTADAQATDLDTDGEYVYVIFNSGEFVVLRTADGEVRARHEVIADGRVIMPLSLTVAGSGRVVIGTLDGKLLACSVDPTRREGRGGPVSGRTQRRW
ncbi:MAG TPA: hypothetical protein VF070_42625 [Streptosporangiaceae bacterium]